MKNSINNKIFQPITFLYSNDDLPLFICKFNIIYNNNIDFNILSAVVMAINIFKESNSSQRFKNALIELTYCLMIYLTMNYLSMYIGNIYSSLLAIIECVIYLNFINPKLMNRKIFFNK